MTVVLTARELIGEGLEVLARPLDASDGECVRSLTEVLEAELGTLDVLVSNAAYADWAEMASELEDTSILVNAVNPA